VHFENSFVLRPPPTASTLAVAREKEQERRKSAKAVNEESLHGRTPATPNKYRALVQARQIVLGMPVAPVPLA
jgi:hypothetical protein